MERPAFWNRLGSRQEVEHSTIGPDAVYNGGGSFEPGRFGGAFFAGAEEDNRVLVPKLGVINPAAGAIEFWGKISGFPESIDWGAQPYFFRDQGTDSRAYWTGGLGFNGNNGIGGGGLATDVSGNGAASGDWLRDWKYSEVLTSDPDGWHHYALVWDAAGIANGGGHIVDIYLDGKLASHQRDFADASDLGAVTVEDSFLGLLDNWGSRGTTAIDNLKIWDYAKTDYADRFVEGLTLVGDGRANCLLGSASADDLRGLGGNDTLLGLAGSDSLRGDSGRDLLKGGAGRDVLIGGSGDDRLYGGDGADRITDGSGRDALWGGSGADVFHFVKDRQLDRINDFGAGDRIDLTAWGGVDYSDLHIVDGGPGTVLVTSASESICVRGAVGTHLSAEDMTADKFIFGDGLDWVQWRTADGGNGHWYALATSTSVIPWARANAEAEALANGSAHLVTLTSADENDFVFEHLASDPGAWNYNLGPYIGLFQVEGSAEPDAGWRWVTDEPLNYTNWSANQPDNAHDTERLEQWGHFIGDPDTGPVIDRAWNDIGDGPPPGVLAYVAEVDNPLAFG